MFEVSTMRIGNKPSRVSEWQNQYSLDRLPDGQEKTKHQCMFRIMTPKDGDVRVVWDSNDLAQINDAKRMFDELIEKGLVPYIIDSQTGKPTEDVMKVFDPDVEEVIFMPTALAVGG